MIRLTGACRGLQGLQAPLGLQAQRGPEAPLMMILVDDADDFDEDADFDDDDDFDDD